MREHSDRVSGGRRCVPVHALCHRLGLTVLRRPSRCMPCCRHSPSETVGSSDRSLAQRRRPPPRSRRVGFRIGIFDACSAFTTRWSRHARQITDDPLHQRLRPHRYLRDRSDCYVLGRPMSGGNFTRVPGKPDRQVGTERAVPRTDCSGGPKGDFFWTSGYRPFGRRFLVDSSAPFANRRSGGP